MSGEPGVIARSPGPVTRAGLAAELGRLGVRSGSVLLVHSALSALGWVCGGAQTVVEALLDALGPDGTLVAPSHTGGNSDPAAWGNPPVPEPWWPVIREHMPAFDPRVTAAHGMGAIAEAVRTWPGARRSAHPQVSFSAVGAQQVDALAVGGQDGRVDLAQPEPDRDRDRPRRAVPHGR